MILLALFAAFLSPPIYSAAMVALAGSTYVHRGVRGGRPLPEGTGVLAATFLVFAALAVLGPTFNHGHSGQNVDAFKFLFATCALLSGIALGLEKQDLARFLPYFLCAMTAFYAGQWVFGDLLNQDSLLYPPDNNHSAAMLAVLLPVVVLNMTGWRRIACLVLFAAFAYFVASRALLASTVVALAFAFDPVRRNRILMVIVGILALAILFLKGFSLDNFSDQLRLQILKVSLNYAETRGAHAFNFGEASFTNYLNIYPIYRRLEIQHAHNLLLQIWAAYGIVPLMAFTTFILATVISAWRQRNTLLLASLAVLMGFGMIEALITDIRAFGTMMFTIGYAFGRGGSGSGMTSSDTATGQWAEPQEPHPNLQ